MVSKARNVRSDWRAGPATNIATLIILIGGSLDIKFGSHEDGVF
jgi:hypothetical protein